MGEDKTKENQGRDEEAKAKEQGEGLGPRDAQGNPIDPNAPVVDNTLPEGEPAPDNTLPNPQP